MTGALTFGPRFGSRRDPVVLILLDCGCWREADERERRAVACGFGVVGCGGDAQGCGPLSEVEVVVTLP